MPKNVRRFPKLISKEELSKVILTIARSTRYDKYGAGKFLRIRDATIQLFLFYTGLRPSEALNLKWADIDFNNRMIHIDALSNKERNEMSAVLTLPAERIINQYRYELELMNIKCEFVFPALWTWKPITVDSAGKLFRILAKEAGINEVNFYLDSGKPRYKLNMYSYRRKFGTEVYNKADDILAVMKLLRLTTPKSIPSYVIYSDEKRKLIADKCFN